MTGITDRRQQPPMTLRIKKIGQYWESIRPTTWVIGIRIHIPGLGRENRTDPTRKKARFAEKRARQAKERACHKGSYEIRTQAPLFVKPGTFDKFSKGNRILPTG